MDGQVPPCPRARLLILRHAGPPQQHLPRRPPRFALQHLELQPGNNGLCAANGKLIAVYTGALLATSSCSIAGQAFSDPGACRRRQFDWRPSAAAGLCAPACLLGVLAPRPAAYAAGTANVPCCSMVLPPAGGNSTLGANLLAFSRSFPNWQQVRQQPRPQRSARMPTQPAAGAPCRGPCPCITASTQCATRLQCRPSSSPKAAGCLQVVADNVAFGWTQETAAVPCSWAWVTCSLQPGFEYNMGGPWVPAPLLGLDLWNLSLTGARPRSGDAGRGCAPAQHLRCGADAAWTGLSDLRARQHCMQLCSCGAMHSGCGWVCRLHQPQLGRPAGHVQPGAGQQCHSRAAARQLGHCLAQAGLPEHGEQQPAEHPAPRVEQFRVVRPAAVHLGQQLRMAGHLASGCLQCMRCRQSTALRRTRAAGPSACVASVPAAQRCSEHVRGAACGRCCWMATRASWAACQAPGAAAAACQSSPH